MLMSRLLGQRRFSLRSKAGFILMLGLVAAALTALGIGTSLAAPLFSAPVNVAGGGRLYYDMSIRVRPTDNRSFIIGAKVAYIGISPTDNPNAFDNINDWGDNSFQYPGLAFGPSSTGGMGYAVWRVRDDVNGYQAYMRLLPGGYPNQSLGGGFTLTGRLAGGFGGGKLDQPDVAVSQQSGHVFVVGGVYKNGPARLVLLELDATATVVLGVTTLNTVYYPTPDEFDPQICMDANENIHVVSLYGNQLYSYSRVGGSWTSSNVTPPGGWDERSAKGRSGKDINCAADGTTYLAVRSNNQYFLNRRQPGVGQAWIQLQSNLFGSPNLKSLAVTTSPDGRVWAAMGDDNIGTYASYSDNQGVTFSPREAVYSNTDSRWNSSVALAGSGPSGKVHLTTAFKNLPPPLPYEWTYYSFATYTPQPTATPAIQVLNSSQISLSWNPVQTSPSGPAADGYRVYRSTDGVNFGLVAAVGTTSFTDSGLNLSTPYFYKVSSARSGFPDSALSSAASATTLGPASLQFAGSPGSAVAGVAFPAQPVVLVLDPNGNLVSNFNGPASISLIPNNGATLNGSLSRNAVNGVIDFSGAGLKINFIGNGYQLRVAAAGLSADSLAFNVTGKLAFATVPSSKANALFSVTVNIQDGNGNPENHFTGPVNLTLSPQTMPPGAVLTGLKTVNASSGAAVFNNLSLNVIGANYRLDATGAGAGAESNAFNITADLAFAPIPTNHATEPFTVTVTVKDGTGNALPTYNGPVYLTYNEGSLGPAAYFFGQTTVNAASGLATFKNLMIDTPATGYSFTAALPGSLATALPSALFNVDGYTAPAVCDRILLSQAVDVCSSPNLQTALSTGVAVAGGAVPVYLDHRAGPTGYGSGQLTITQAAPLTLPANAWFDAGCSTGGAAQGLKLIVDPTNKLIVGGNNFLRGLYLSGTSNTTGLFSVLSATAGNKVSCSKVVSEAPQV